MVVSATVDPKHHLPSIVLAPGSGHPEETLHLPGPNEPLPRIDERLAPPETRLEYLHGAEIFAAPADRPHATEHCELTFVLRAHIARGYTGAVDMLTRTGHATDIAPDASVFASDPDPLTGGRRLEELAFEVTSEQALKVPTEKARELIGRGVRRVFCILVRQRRVLEWSRHVDGWATLPESAVIEDQCLVRPLPVAALLNASAADSASAQALLDKHVPVIEAALAEREARGEMRGEARGEMRGEVRGEMRGEARGRAVSLLAILEARGLHVDVPLRERILGTTNTSLLDLWVERAVVSATIEDVFRGG